MIERIAIAMHSHVGISDCNYNTSPCLQYIKYDSNSKKKKYKIKLEFILCICI